MGRGSPDLKLDANKTQTFHSDVDENYSNAGSGSGSNPQGLLPIILPMKKGSKKSNKFSPSGGNSSSANNHYLSAFNQTKKQFPVLNKINQQSKKQNSYVSPYSLKNISKP